MSMWGRCYEGGLGYSTRMTGRCLAASWDTTANLPGTSLSFPCNHGNSFYEDVWAFFSPTRPFSSLGMGTNKPVATFNSPNVMFAHHCTSTVCIIIESRQLKSHMAEDPPYQRKEHSLLE